MRRRELSDLNITFPYPSADWTPETGYPDQSGSGGSVLETPWRPVGTGTHLGLSISLDSELHDYYCSSTSSAGFKVKVAAATASHRGKRRGGGRFVRVVRTGGAGRGRGG